MEFWAGATRRNLLSSLKILPHDGGW
jgi:hypothetical protein